MIRIDKIHAQCKKCGANVGCGCQLKNGLCPTCHAQEPKK